MHPTVSLLLNHYPRLSFTDLPSPVFAADPTSETANVLNNVYIKHDGVCAKSYAGNKVRKLEFLLAEAQQNGVTHVVTLGAAGSNHAVATSTYARKLGMRCTVCMTHQPPGPVATKNLRRHLVLGTQLHVYPRFSQAVAHATALAEDPATQLIPLGGSAPLASLGYITAADELAQQIEQGLLPCPERVYVACGTMGTAVGLTLGFALLNLPVQVVAVRVTERAVASPELFADLYADSVDLLIQHEPELGLNRSLQPHQLHFVDEFFGNAYAEPTTEGLNAIQRAATIGVTLDSTYTGKAFAALLAHKHKKLFTGPALFWCTLNAIDTPLAEQSALTKLGQEFARYR